MIIAIQQPEHLPWMGFFNKMAQVDLFVYLDNVQFKKRYFENRNKIKTKDGIKWLTVPVQTKGRYKQRINEVMIDNSVNRWIRKYINILENGYKKSAFWEEVKSVVLPSLQKENLQLKDLNRFLIQSCREYLNIHTEVILASTLEVDDFTGSDIILEICKILKTKVYVSGPDGRNYLNLERFSANKIDVAYHDFNHPTYPQMYGDFQSHLSVIDLIANCGPVSKDLIKKSNKIESK